MDCGKAVDRFDHFIAIDWSGAKGERLHGIAIACCKSGTAAPILIDAGRRWSRAEVLNWLNSALPANALVGLDLSPGLPFDPVEGYFSGWVDSPKDAKALWQMVDEICADDPHFAASSFVAHPEARRHFRHGKGDCGDRFERGSGRLRITEKQQARQNLTPSSCFNLVGAAQVGKSSLTGMRVLHNLRGSIPIWPFDPMPERESVIVEIYTSLAARAAGMRKGRSKIRDGKTLDQALAMLGSEAHASLSTYTDHATDAILTSAWLRANAARSELWQPEGLTPEIASCEGWTFGVA
jgi:hypothetical protein